MNKFGKMAHLIDRIFNPLLDIEVFGMYGPGNLGDEAMLTAAQMHLPAQRCASYQTYLARPALGSVLRQRPLRHLLVAGGTLIHGGKTGWLDYVEMRSQQGVHVSFLGTGLAFLSEQIEQRSDAFKRWSDVLQNSNDIYLRGPQSAELARTMCGRGEVFGDFAFLLHRDDLVPKCHDCRTAEVGVNIGNCLGDQENFEKTIGFIIKNLSENFIIVFHAVYSADIPVIEKVVKRVGLPGNRYRIESDFFDASQFIEKIKDYRAFIGLKMHAAGLAMICGVPTIMISYLPKCQDFVAPLLNGANVLLELPLDRELAMEKVERLLSDPEEFTFADEIGRIAVRQRKIIKTIFALEH